jgi:iron complex outermembrane receptor protein
MIRPIWTTSTPRPPARTSTRTASKGGRAALLFKPTDIFTVDLSAMRQRLASSAARRSASVRHAPARDRLHARLWRVDAEPRPDPRDVDFTLYQGRVNYDLGFADLTSISAWNDIKSKSDLDQTNTFGFLLPAFSAPPAQARR